MATTIQVSNELLTELKNRRLYERESYEEVIYNLMEDSKELNEETLKEIEDARREIRSGKYYTLDQVRKELRR